MNIIQLHKMVMEAKGDNYPHIGSLDLSKSEDEGSKKKVSGFCEINDDINRFALESPENLIEVIIFVVATQLMRWPDVVGQFSHLMVHLVANDGIFNKNKKEGEKDFPLFGGIVFGKTKEIDSLWRNRNSHYSNLSPLIEEFNNAASAKKEEAAFRVYLGLLGLPKLGLPKAGFATQLIIGRLGCIDSINKNILEVPKELLSTDSKGKTGFKSIDKEKDKDTGELTGNISKRSVELAKRYADYLSVLGKLSNTNITQNLWDDWCDIVAHKINNPATQFDVVLKNGLPGGRIKSDYPKNYAKGSGSDLFVSRFRGNITGRDVSRQHHPTHLKAALTEIIKREIGKLLKRK